jgi:heat shock protein HslJ
MVSLRWGFAGPLVGLILSSSLWPAAAADSSFPFGSELLLDIAPMPGTKRVPMLEVDENGAATIDLWCVSARQQATIDNNSITFTPQPVEHGPCAPALLSADEDLLATFAAVTSWRRSGDTLELLGATTLRFHPMTN